MSREPKEKKKYSSAYQNDNLKVILIVVVILIVAVFGCYFMVVDSIIDSSIKNMEELARHDERAMQSSLGNRWEAMEGIAADLRQKKCETTIELLRCLNSDRQFVGCIRLTLVSDQGVTLNSNMEINNAPDLLALCLQENDRFVHHRDNLDAAAEGRGEILVMGIAITPITVEDENYSWLLCRMDIDTLQEELKIDSYEGRGYSSVIDSEGNYIVKANRNHTAQVRENFFRDVENGELLNGYTLDRIKQQLQDNQSFFVSYIPAGGETQIVAFIPMEGTNWYFIMSVPRAVFEEQSISLTMIFAMLLGIVFFACGLIGVALMQRRNVLLKMETEHRKELAEALVLAEQANRAKTTFLNNMSHDIRTPMNAIIGFTALATTHIENRERVRDYLTKIAQSSSHLLSLINDVLDMSRIESGKMILEEKAEDLAEIMHNIRNIVQTDIHSKQLEFFIDTVDITDEGIYCDRLRLNQILLNLLSNAMKFTSPGGTVAVRIIQKPAAREGYGMFEFRVKDTGIGMSPEFAKTIFEPFTRERTSTVSGIQGTGLGMSITKNIVDMMNGTIEVFSEQGKGTEFVVNLEFKLQEGHKEIMTIPDLEGLRSLVVDDDSTACQSVSKMLREIGMRSEWTMYGKEAIIRTSEAIEMGDPYHVYIIDWLMPDMNGVETVRRIRALVGQEIPIIILSAYDWADVEEEAKEAGVTGFISKPLFQSELRHALLKACSKEEKELTVAAVTENFQGRRILLTEDNMLNQEIAIAILEEAGFQVETAMNGQEAVEQLKKSEPGYYDLILMDVQMPVMDGHEAAREIRKFENRALARIPIIAMTANAFEEDRQAALDAGMNGHIGKPIDIPVLMDTLKRILNG